MINKAKLKFLHIKIYDPQSIYFRNRTSKFLNTDTYVLHTRLLFQRFIHKLLHCVIIYQKLDTLKNSIISYRKKCIRSPYNLTIFRRISGTSPLYNSYLETYSLFKKPFLPYQNVSRYE